MTIELTQSQFRDTMTATMVDVTDTVEPVVDIWPYVELLLGQNIVVEYVFDNHLIESVFRDMDNSFDHILLPTEKPNIYITIIIDIMRKEIIGHYRLDLDEEYGLS